MALVNFLHFLTCVGVNTSLLAYCDVIQYLPCYEWVVKEAKRYGPKWSKCWAQETALKKIASCLSEILSEHAYVVDTTLYPQWMDFLKHFLQVGGLIEAAPPSDSVTPLAVDLLIEPTGRVEVLCTHDQVTLQEVFINFSQSASRFAVQNTLYVEDLYHKHLSLTPS